MRIYCVHPISGMTADEVFTYYTFTRDKLKNMGYDVLTPMVGKGYARTELEFKAQGYDDKPVSNNHAIFTRDKWMVKRSDIIYANFLDVKRTSIGSMMELAWGSDNGKQIVTVMEEDNIHRHAFVLEASSIVFTTVDDAMSYLEVLITGNI